MKSVAVQRQVLPRTTETKAPQHRWDDRPGGDADKDVQGEAITKYCWSEGKNTVGISSSLVVWMPWLMMHSRWNLVRPMFLLPSLQSRASREFSSSLAWRTKSQASKLLRRKENRRFTRSSRRGKRRLGTSYSMIVSTQPRDHTLLQRRR